MLQTLSTVPNLNAQGQKTRSISRRPSAEPRGYEVDELDAAPAGNRLPLFPDINVRIPVGKLLALTAAIVFGFIVISHFAQLGAFLNGFVYDPANAGISGDPVITGMVDWLPILLVGLSAVVLAGLVINRTQYRRELRQAGPRLVSKPVRQAATPKTQVAVRPARAARHAMADQPATPQDTPKLFLVSGTPEDRHEAQEQVRLERDARASAIARAAAAARLVISGSVRIHESEALVVQKPRRVLASMPAPAPPARQDSGVFFPAATIPPTFKAANITAPRLHLSRAPQTPPPAMI